MLLSSIVSATAMTGGHKAFPKLSPLTSTLRIHPTFHDAGAGAKLSNPSADASSKAKDCAGLSGSGCRSRSGNIKMQAVAAGSATMTVAQACAFMQDPSLSSMTVEAKLEFLASKGVDAFVGSQASCTSLGMYTSFGPVTGGDAAPAAPPAPAAAAPAAAAAAAPAKVERFSDPSKGLSPVDEPYPTAMLEAMGGYDVETGGGIWDPLRLAAAPEADLKWYRQAEIKWGSATLTRTRTRTQTRTRTLAPTPLASTPTRARHGRVAMLACVGYAASKAGVVFLVRRSTSVVPRWSVRQPSA